MGRRIHRRSRPGHLDQAGVASLIERELQIARLIGDRKTNGEIAGQLFLSKKTIEMHIRNMFGKLDANSRIDIARTIEAAERVAGNGDGSSAESRAPRSRAGYPVADRGALSHSASASGLATQIAEFPSA